MPVPPARMLVVRRSRQAELLLLDWRAIDGEGEAKAWDGWRPARGLGLVGAEVIISSRPLQVLDRVVDGLGGAAPLNGGLSRRRGGAPLRFTSRTVAPHFGDILQSAPRMSFSPAMMSGQRTRSDGQAVG
jgi:hypothetical protein